MDKCRKRPDSRPLVASSRQSTPAYQDPSFLQLGLRPFPACSSTQRRENWGAQKAKIKSKKIKKISKLIPEKKSSRIGRYQNLVFWCIRTAGLTLSSLSTLLLPLSFSLPLSFVVSFVFAPHRVTSSTLEGQVKGGVQEVSFPVYGDNEWSYSFTSLFISFFFFFWYPRDGGYSPWSVRISFLTAARWVFWGVSFLDWEPRRCVSHYHHHR